NSGTKEEKVEIKDLFDYYYGEENKKINTYNLEYFDSLDLASGYWQVEVEEGDKIKSTFTTPFGKNINYIWTTVQQLVFEALKNKLITALALAYPDFSKTFILFTDASDLVLDVILSQKNEKGNEQVVYYTSHSLTTIEKNYSVMEKEYLAIVWAVEYFRPYLYRN
ncbi:15143_t:CDS:2, partial [Gigaspora rosea]